MEFYDVTKTFNEMDFHGDRKSDAVRHYVKKTVFNGYIYGLSAL